MPRGVGNDHDLVGRFFMSHYPIQGFGKVLFVVEDVDAVMQVPLLPDAARTSASRTRRAARAPAPRRGLPVPPPEGVRFHRPPPRRAWSRSSRRSRASSAEATLDRGRCRSSPSPSRRPTARAASPLGAERDFTGMRRGSGSSSAGRRPTWRACARRWTCVSRELGRHALGRLQTMFAEDALPTPAAGSAPHGHDADAPATRARASSDPDGRVHGVDNLYVAGPSVFPSGGFANPVLTIIALALRLADHLKAKRAHDGGDHPARLSRRAPGWGAGPAFASACARTADLPAFRSRLFRDRVLDKGPIADFTRSYLARHPEERDPDDAGVEALRRRAGRRRRRRSSKRCALGHPGGLRGRADGEPRRLDALASPRSGSGASTSRSRPEATMKVRTMRLVDRLLGVPACALFTAVRKLRPGDGRPGGPGVRKILFVKLVEQGTTVLARAAFEAAAARVGREHVYCLTLEENRGILDLMGLIPPGNVLAVPGARRSRPRAASPARSAPRAAPASTPSWTSSSSRAPPR